MRLPEGEWLVLEEVSSTQDIAAELLSQGERMPSVILALHQTAGKGRLGRTWLSPRGGSLAASIPFAGYADHPRPWLIGMALAAAAAGALHCQVRWPNDLTVGGKKLGGILTELLPGPGGTLVPVVGIGVNLGQIDFPPELDAIATTLASHIGQQANPEETLGAILLRAEGMPEPVSWQDIEPVWRLFDDTAGKRYRTPAGDEAVALGIGSEGELIASLGGESVSIRAAEAIFGPT
ncbi:MAG: biotin--[acetyl-CoA-carboxylase] ligase [Fimbriimonadaceae bacterium]